MRKKLLQGTLVGLGSAAVSLWLWSAGWLVTLEYVTWGWRVHGLARPAAATESVKLILLDQASLDWGAMENGWSWPWPRQVYAPILDFCKRGGARVVFFDVLFTEPSVYGVEDDELLGAALQNTGRAGVAMFAGEQARQVSAWPTDFQRPGLALQGLDGWLTPERAERLREPGAAFPVPEVGVHAAFLANVKDEPDRDGVFRRISLFRIFDSQVLPVPGLAAYLAGREAEGAVSIGEKELRMGATLIPVDDMGRVILRFRGGDGTHEAFSAAAVIQSELRLASGEGKPVVDPEELRDCYVLFGFSAPALKDLKPTPIAGDYAGVALHATFLDNLLEADALRDAPGYGVWFVTILLSLIAAIVVVSFSRRAWHSVVIFALFLPLPLALGFAAYAAGWWWPVVVGTFAVGIALFGGVTLNYATEGRQKAFIKRAFRHYLSPVVIDRILADPSQLKLGGERRELSIFFSDLQGFSSISERLEPQALTQLLNEYLTDMTDIILDEGGTLDKYEGDAIIAFWNAPLTQPDHAERACRAALRCQRKLAERRPEFSARTGAELWMRIGVNTGEVVVGNMGSKERFDYTVLGDAANLAARLEGANKAFGSYTMVAESTWKKSGEELLARETGKLRVVGRKTPVGVFELVGFASEGRPEHVAVFEEGLALCKERKWQDAIRRFEVYPDDPIAAAYAARCRQILLKPAEGWDMVWNLTEK